MSVYLSRDPAKHEKQIEAICQKFSAASISCYNAINGREWTDIVTLRGELTDNALFWLKIKTYAQIVFSLGIAYFFQCIKDNLETIKTKNLRLKVFVHKDTSNAEINNVHAITERLMSDKAGNEKLQEIRKKAISGDATAQCELGRCYLYEDKGVKENFAKALEWLNKAVAQKHEDAELYLGVYHSKNNNQQEALNLWEKLAAKKHIKANAKLGAYFSGEKMAVEDNKKAIPYLQVAADAGDAHSQFLLGLCYKEGKGVTQSNSDAITWLQKAKSQEHMGAKYALNGFNVVL